MILEITRAIVLGLVFAMACPLPMQAQSPAGGSALQAENTYLEATRLRDQGDFDGALAKVTEALQEDTGNPRAYVLRGDLYTKKQLWSQAGQDFSSALKIDPDNDYAKFDLAEIKLMQKQYRDARPGFAALVNDKELGDLAAYKVFLCDLYGGNSDDATRELDAFNKVESGASFYYANAAWCLYYRKTDEAKTWLESAARIYAREKNLNYLSTLKELGYMPLPGG